MWLWVLLAFAVGIGLGVLIRLIGEQLADIGEMGHAEDWWL